MVYKLNLKFLHFLNICPIHSVGGGSSVGDERCSDGKGRPAGCGDDRPIPGGADRPGEEDRYTGREAVQQRWVGRVVILWFGSLEDVECVMDVWTTRLSDYLKCCLV